MLTFISDTDSYIYVLDDDNLLPRNFFDYDYNTKESLVYLFPQLRGGKIIEPQPLIDLIDQAQFLAHASVFSFFKHHNRCSDGIHIEKICNEVPYKCLEQPVVYYNKLRTPLPDAVNVNIPQVQFNEYLNELILSKIWTNESPIVETLSKRTLTYEVKFLPRPKDMLDGLPVEQTVHVVYDKMFKSILKIEPTSGNT